MKRFLSHASKGSGNPSKKVKGRTTTAVQHSSLPALSHGTAVQTKAISNLAKKLQQKEWTDLDNRGSKVLYWPRLLSSISKRVLSSLLAEVQWEQVRTAVNEQQQRLPSDQQQMGLVLTASITNHTLQQCRCQQIGHAHVNCCSVLALWDNAHMWLYILKGPNNRP